MITFYDLALSPFCRKVRFVLEHKGLAFNVVDDAHVSEFGHLSPRAELPILVDGDIVVVNSADIVAHLEHRFPQPPVFPADPRERVKARAWERTADTLVDAIVTDIAIWTWSNIGPRPDGLLEAAQRDLGEVYDALDAALGESPFVCGAALTIADYALYPHLAAAYHLGINCSPARHPRVHAWLKRLRALPPMQADLERVKQWWSNREHSKVEPDRINWGTHRLEWFLANGFHDFFAEQIRQDKVLWSVGPKRNAHRAAKGAAPPVTD